MNKPRRLHPDAVNEYLDTMLRRQTGRGEGAAIKGHIAALEAEIVEAQQAIAVYRAQNDVDDVERAALEAKLAEARALSVRRLEALRSWAICDGNVGYRGNASKDSVSCDECAGHWLFLEPERHALVGGLPCPAAPEESKP